MVDSSDSFFVDSRNKSLGFVIALLGMMSGLQILEEINTQHKWLNPEKDLEYWENGTNLDITRHDYPATISFVKNLT